MAVVTVVHLEFDTNNDPQGFAKRHVARQLSRDLKQSDIVRDAWLHDHDPVPNAITSTSFSAPPIVPSGEIYYDPAVVGSASEDEVIEALIKAGRR